MIERDKMNEILIGTTNYITKTFAWDNLPPVMSFAIQVEHPDGPGLDLEVLPIEIQPPVSRFLNYFASYVEAESTFSMAAAQQKNLVGLMLTTEAWGIEKTGAALRTHKVGTIPDDPGAYELRAIQLVDIYGRAFLIHQKRGEEPKPTLENGGELGGMIFPALAKILRTVVRHQQDGDKGLALNKLLRQIKDTNARIAADQRGDTADAAADS